VADGPAPRRLLGAVAAGLCGALIIGGAGLLWSGVRAVTSSYDCMGMPPDECAMEREIATAGGRDQVHVGALFTVVGAGLAIWLWRKA
jgi:hypothetical protein